MNEKQTTKEVEPDLTRLEREEITIALRGVVLALVEEIPVDAEYEILAHLGHAAVYFTGKLARSI